MRIEIHYDEPVPISKEHPYGVDVRNLILEINRKVFMVKVEVK